MIGTPRFWDRPDALAGRLLAPLGALYGRATLARMRRTGAVAPVPVVCIGNPTVGGAGKTPTAIAIAALLQEAGRKAGFLSRGHGGRARGPVEVDPDLSDAFDVGDEPLFLARHAPTMVSRDRPAGAARLAALGINVIIMDDGFQNPSLQKQAAILVVDASAGVGNGRVFPAGPLRAPLRPQLGRADLLILVGEGARGEAVAADARRCGLAVVRARFVPTGSSHLRGARIVAFSGIARPEKFEATLAGIGAIVAEHRAFADHHRFRPTEAASLVARSLELDARLVTTEKDMARLPRGVAWADELRRRASTVPVAIRFDDPQAVAAAILARLGLARLGPVRAK